MTAVAAEGVWKFYGDYPALRDVKLAVEPGSCMALIGRNGAGKTTLLRIIAGFSQPGRGKIKILGSEPRETATRRKMGFIGHGIAVYDELSALENLTLFGKLYRIPERGERIGMLLERYGLWNVRHERAGTFSRGMLQRLALCRTILHEPELLLLDEPFNALDADGAALLERELTELRGGRTLVVATHDPARLEPLASARLAVE